MEVYDFSISDYWSHNFSKFRIKRMGLLFLIFIVIISFVAMLYCISMGLNIDIILFLTGSILVSSIVFSALLGITNIDIDYFDLRNTFYVMFKDKLYLVTVIPRDRFGAYEEIGNFRMFLFLMFGKDVLKGSFIDHTEKFGPTKKDVLTNFSHFIYHNDFDTLTVEELGFVSVYEDNIDNVKVITTKDTYYIKKYYSNLINITNHIVNDKRL